MDFPGYGLGLANANLDNKQLKFGNICVSYAFLPADFQKECSGISSRPSCAC